MYVCTPVCLRVHFIVRAVGVGVFKILMAALWNIDLTIIHTLLLISDLRFARLMIRFHISSAIYFPLCYSLHKYWVKLESQQAVGLLTRRQRWES